MMARCGLLDRQRAIFLCLMLQGSLARSTTPVDRSDSFAVQATFRTLWLMLFSTAIAVLLGWGYAYLSERLVGRSRALWRLVPLCSVSLPLFIHAAAWEATLGKFGWLPLSGVTARGSFFAGAVASSWIHGITGAAWVALIVGAALRRGPVPGELAAQLDAGPFRTALHVTLPSCSPLLQVSGLWVALIAATEISVVDLYGYRTLADEVYFQYALSPQPLPILAAVLLPAVLCVGLLVLVGLRRQRIVRPTVEASLRDAFPASTVASKTRRLAVACLAGLASSMLLLPLASLVIKAGWMVEPIDGQLHSSWSAAQTISTVTQAVGMFQLEYYWTAMLAATTIVMTLPVAVLLAWIGRKRPAPIACLCLLLVFVPGPVISVAIMQLFSQPEVPSLAWLYDRTLIPAGLAIMHRAVPIGCLILLASYYQSNRRIDEAARVDGSSRWQRLRLIEFPRLLRPLAICGFVSAVLALGEISATELVLPPGVSTVARRVFGLLHSGVRYQESGLCLVSSAVVLVTVVVFRVCQSAMRRR